MVTVDRVTRPGGAWDYDVTLTDGRKRTLHSETEQADPVAWATAWEIANAIRELEAVVNASE
jgi:hypothetical protein